VTRKQRALLDSFSTSRSLRLPPDFHDRVTGYLHLLDSWSRAVRLTGDRDPDVLVAKHCADSLAAAALAGERDRVVDVGSGAGFPGVVMALARPGCRVALVESKRKVCSFLNEVVANVEAGNAFVLWGRAEQAALTAGLGGSFDLAVSRAIAPASFLPLAVPFLNENGKILMMTTPAMDERSAALLGDPHGLVVERTVDYGLPSGEARRILVFSRR